MKKFLLLLVVLFGINNANSQVIFQENWDGLGPGISAWTLYNVDNLIPATSTNLITQAWVTLPQEFDNKSARSTSRYTPAGTANDWLVSPSVTIPATGTPILYWEATSYDSSNRDSYRVLISTTGNTVADFTNVLFTSEAAGENVFWSRRLLNLSDYAGQTIYIAFQNISTNKFVLGIDNISIVNNTTSASACFPPSRDIFTSAVTATTATISLFGGVSFTGFEVAIGAPGFTPTVAVGTTVGGGSSDNVTYTFTGLTPGTRYQCYARNSCGGMWVGPYSIFTATNLPYSYGFETTAANGGYQADNWLGAFNLNGGGAAALYADGVQMVFSNSSTTATTDRWLYSRPINLVAGEVVTLQFSTRGASSNAEIINTLAAKVGTQPTTAAQTTTLSTVTVPVSGTYTENTATYTAPAAGTYYFSFNHTAPITLAGSSLLLDKIVMSSVLGINEVLASKFSVYPNPSNNVINITNDDKMVLNGVTITDLNGRTVQSIKLNNANTAQVNISDLAAGMYLMNISSDQGNVTKKIIKN